MTPLRIALIYLVVSLAWILFSDKTVHWFTADPAQILKLQTAKGWAFVVVTSLLIYSLAWRLQKVLIRELNAKRKLLAQIRRKAYTDYLTNLPNRRMGLRIMRQFIRQHQKVPTEFYVLFIDLDNFKQINDTLGHVLGDKVILAAAQRLRQFVSGEQHLIYHGGDEFFIVMKKSECVPDLPCYAQELIDAFNEPLQMGRLRERRR